MSDDVINQILDKLADIHVMYAQVNNIESMLESQQEILESILSAQHNEE